MGYQEPSPRPGRQRQGITAVWWIALPLLGLALWVWVDQRSEMASEPKSQPIVGEQPESEPPAEVPADSGDAAQVARLQEMLQQAESQLADQRAEIDSLEDELDAAQAEAERNRQGLERAVDELNRINEELNQLEAAAMVRQGASPPPMPSPQVGPLGAPHVTTHQFGYVVASGLVHNPTGYPARGTLEVSIVGSAGVIDTRGFSMTISPGRTERYDVTFTNVFPTERLGAQARWVP